MQNAGRFQTSVYESTNGVDSAENTILLALFEENSIGTGQSSLTIDRTIMKTHKRDKHKHSSGPGFRALRGSGAGGANRRSAEILYL